MEAASPTMNPIEDLSSLSFKSAVNIIRQWDSETIMESKRSREQPMIFDCDRHKINQYLEAVDVLHLWERHAMTSACLNEANQTIKIAMARLKFEFCQILAKREGRVRTNSPIYLNSETPSIWESDTTSSGFHYGDYEDYEANPSEEEIYDIKSILQRMNSDVYLSQCCDAYVNHRKAVFLGKILALNLVLVIPDIRCLDQEELEAMIKRLAKSAKVCVRIIFACERQLCDQIFEDDRFVFALADDCFVQIINDFAYKLLSSFHSIIISKRLHKRAELMILLVFTFLDVKFDVDIIFQSKSAQPIRNHASLILSELSKELRRALLDTEHAVSHELSNFPIPGGTIHPLTKYVKKYISMISDHKNILSGLIAPFMGFLNLEGQSPLGLHLIRIISNLVFNLDSKSKYYKDPSLGHVFMMNNVHYITQNIKSSSELLEMIGADCLDMLTAKVRQAQTNYMRFTWDKVLHCITVEEPPQVTWNFFLGRQSALRGRLKTFNIMFEDIRQTQATWEVLDWQLQEELHKSILEKLKPAYKSFLEHFGKGEKHPNKYIKYSVEELDTMILNFFLKKSNDQVIAFANADAEENNQ